MKYKLVSLIRALGLLKVADSVKFWLQRIVVAGPNRKFRIENPDFAVPPHNLAYDALNHSDWEAYRDVGLRHAAVYARIIEEEAKDGSPIDTLEWGCGPGRLIRHMAQLIPAHTLRLAGSDYNKKSIDWCRSNLPGIEFLHNELMPPLPFTDARFDVVYNYSVFTHLSEEVQKAWAAEMLRVLKPGGILISTTHGDDFRYLLTKSEDKRRYENDRLVIQGKYREGKKFFFAIHPPAYVRNQLFGNFSDVRLYATEESDELMQDVWIARK